MGRSLGLPHAGCSLPGRAPAAFTGGTACAARTAGASALLPAAEAARTGACGAASFPGLTRSRGQQTLDRQRDLAVRCNVDDLHLYCIAIVQHGVDILHKFVGYLGNVDHADTPLRQRNKCAKGLYTGHAAFEYVPYLNCQNSILLAFQILSTCRAVSYRSHPQRCARWVRRSCKSRVRPIR